MKNFNKQSLLLAICFCEFKRDSHIFIYKIGRLRLINLLRPSNNKTEKKWIITLFVCARCSFVSLYSRVSMLFCSFLQCKMTNFKGNNYEVLKQMKRPQQQKKKINEKKKSRKKKKIDKKKRVCVKNN